MTQYQNDVPGSKYTDLTIKMNENKSKTHGEVILEKFCLKSWYTFLGVSNISFR